MKLMKRVIFMSALLAASQLKAANVFQNENTRLDVYGRAYLYFEDAANQEIGGRDSRFGFRTSTKVNEGLTVYANAEFRYAGDETANSTLQIRNTFVGIKGGFGDLLLGNFDSVYYRATTINLDFFNRRTNNFLVALGNGATASRADSIAFLSHDMNGLKVMAQVKHYAPTEEFVAQMAGIWKKDSLQVGLGLVVDNEDAVVGIDPLDEPLLGISVSWQMSQVLSLRAVYETRDDDDTIGLGLIYKYGQGEIYSTVGQDRNNDSYINFGVNYKFSKPMYLFAELGDGKPLNPTDDSVLTLGVRYDF
jgi:predicted porin